MRRRTEKRGKMKSRIMWKGDGELDILALAGGERNFWVQRNFHQLRNIVYNCYLCVSLPIKHRNRNSLGWICSGEYSFHSLPRSHQNSPLVQMQSIFCSLYSRSDFRLMWNSRGHNDIVTQHIWPTHKKFIELGPIMGLPLQRQAKITSFLVLIQ